MNAKAPTPDWMKQRIERSGIRSISALVDVTNYVMLELGQPLHAFDNAELTGAIHVRYPPGRRDNCCCSTSRRSRSTPTPLLIADDAKPLAMAGIMGGEDSGITLDTTDLFLETRLLRADRHRRHGASLGFPPMPRTATSAASISSCTRRAIERATQLILDICGGQPGPVVEAVAAVCRPARRCACARPAPTKVLGLPLAAEHIAELFTGLALVFRAAGRRLPRHAAVAIASTSRSKKT